MDKSGKFLLPSPKFKTLETSSSRVRHFLSPQGIQLLPKEQQPPPMYGPRGTTLPPKFLSPLKVPTTNNQFDRKQKYFCEPCEAEFHTSTDYKVHKSEHVQCEIDECKFRGHPAFMDTHIGQQHATGLYNQLKKLSTPEEIAQWRADRKKNYPTVASVEQKYKAREQRILRGEKLEMQNKKRFGNRADRRQIKGEKSTSENFEKVISNKRKRNNKKNKKQRDRKFEKKKKEDVSPLIPKKEEELSVEVASCGGLRMFEGTGGMADYKKVKKTETNVLSSLLGMYGSDSEEDTEESSEEEEVPEKDNEESDEKTPKKDEQSIRTKDLSVESPILELEPESQMESEKSTSQKTSIKETAKEFIIAKASELQSSDDEGPVKAAVFRCSSIPEKPEGPILELEPESKMKTGNSTSQETSIKDFIIATATEPELSDDEGPEEAVISKSTNIPDKPQTEPPRKKTKLNPLKRKPALDYRKLRVGKQNTMLEKLLEKDIRHERNVLLQCVRFVVQNNFFDKPKSG